MRATRARDDLTPLSTNDRRFDQGTNAPLCTVGRLAYNGTMEVRSAESARISWGAAPTREALHRVRALSVVTLPDAQEEPTMTASTAIITAVLLSAVASANAQGVNDAQIASIVVTANQVDIDAGKLAHATSTSADVKKFAQLMIDDHTGVNKAATELVTRLKVTPEDNPTSQSLKSEGEKNLAELKTLKGMAFDKAYIDHEVTYHQQVIDAIDKTLIPDASNAELKALLVKARPVFVSHLQHAKELQASMSK